MDKDIDVQFLCKDCARYDLCEYYHRRKKNSYICKYFHTNEQEPCKDAVDGLRFFISQYVDGTLEIECKHIHYAFRDGLNFDGVQREELIDRMAEIQEHCEAEGLTAKFVVL